MPWQPNDAPEEQLAILAQELSPYQLPVEESVQLFAPLLSRPVPVQAYPPLHLSPQRQRQKTLEALVAILGAQAAQHPVWCILADVPWTDPTTLEGIVLLLDQPPTASLVGLLTCRPPVHPAWHHRSSLTAVTLSHFSHAQVAQMVTGMTDGKIFPAAVLQQIIAKTDGVPLCVEEITKALRASGQLKAVDGHYALPGSFSPCAIPATLHDALMARLDRLVTAKAVAQSAAVLGRQFAYDLLQAVSPLDALTLPRALGRLVEAEIVYQKGVPPQATDTLKPARIQEAAYESLLKSTRRHSPQRIAQVREAPFPATAAAQPELRAHHCTEAGLIAQAVGSWHKAGHSAIQRSAPGEAITPLRPGLALLEPLPETPQRFQREVDLLIALGASLLATKGYTAPAVGETSPYARQLCEHLDDPHQLFPVLRGLWHSSSVRAELQTAPTLGEQLLSLAQHVPDAAMLLAAHRALGATWLMRGAGAAAHTHFAQGRALYDPQQHRVSAFLYGADAGVVCARHDAWTLGYLGYPDQGLTRNHEAVARARQRAYPRGVRCAVNFAAMFHQLRREGHQTAQEYTEASIRVATDQGVPFWRARGALLRGWALAHQGHAQKGIEQLHQGLSALRATAAELGRPGFLALLAEAHGTMGQPEAGLTVLPEALTLVDTTGERWYEPELYRLKGELLLAQSPDNHTEAEPCFPHALEIARSQQAKSLDLRAATSLARLWQRQGKRQEAYDLLAPVYGWFTEGLDTADLQEAQALLEELA